MNKARIIDIVAAVIGAIILWAYVINVVNPPATTVIRNIPVELTGEEILNYNKLAISGEGNYTVDVELSGTRSVLNGIDDEDVYATADLSTLRAGQNYITVTVGCPDTVTVSDVRSQKIQVYVEELVIEDKPLNIHFSEAPEGYEATILKYDSDVVAVSGPKSFVDMVAEVRVDIDVATLQIDTVTAETYAAAPLDADGKLVELVNISDEIAVSSVLYGLKTVPLKLNITGSPAFNANVRSKTYPEEVIIKGPAKRLAETEYVEAESISIQGIVSDRTYEISAQLPAGMYYSDTSPELVCSIELVNAGSNSFSFTTADVTVVGLTEGYVCEFQTTDSISVTAKATLNLIKKLQASEIAPCIDVTGFEPGVYSVELESLHGSGEIVYEFAPSIVDVLIKPEPVIVGYDINGDPIYEDVPLEEETSVNTESAAQ